MKDGNLMKPTIRRDMRSFRNRVFSACFLLFLYLQLTGHEEGDLGNAIRARKPRRLSLFAVKGVLF